MSLVPNDLDYTRLIKEYIKLATGLPHVYNANMNAPVTSYGYATILLISDMKQGFNSETHVYNALNDNMEYILTSNHIIQYSIQLYRDSNVIELARKLSLFSGTPTGKFFLETNNLTIVNWSTIRNLDTIVDGEYEKRSSIDITFGVIVTYTQTTEVIKSVDIGISMQDVDIINEEINIQE